MDSRQVNWFEVYEFAERWVASKSFGDLDLQMPIAGTPQWCSLPDEDARKLLAVIFGGVREALANDTHQAALAEASRAVAASPNWRTRPRGASYIPRRKEIA